MEIESDLSGRLDKKNVLRQGSALSPLLFTATNEVMRKVATRIRKKTLKEMVL